MKKLFCGFLLLMMNLAAAQLTDVTIEPVYPKDVQEIDIENHIFTVSSVETNPEFPTGLQNFYKIFDEQFKLSDPNLKGKLFISFVIEKDGNLSDIKVVRDLGYNSAAEAIRVMKRMPKWIPGSVKGKKVRTLYTMPIPIGQKKP